MPQQKLSEKLQNHLKMCMLRILAIFLAYNSNLFTLKKPSTYLLHLLHVTNMRYDEEERLLIWHDLENRLRKEDLEKARQDQSTQEDWRQLSQSQSNQEDRRRRLSQIAGMMPIPRIG